MRIYLFDNTGSSEPQGGYLNPLFLYQKMKIRRRENRHNI
jgi:hypothetical protein